MPAAPITALIYSDGPAADAALRALAREWQAQGLTLAGLVQHNVPRASRRRCDMLLEDLSTGARFALSQDRGAEARGCTLDVGQLMAAFLAVRKGLALRPDRVILNKFGKMESEGRGLRALIAEALESGIPLVIAVPWRNIESWRAFSGGLGVEVVLEETQASVGTVLLSEMVAPQAPS